MRKLAVLSLILALVLGVAGYFLWRHLGRQGASRLEQWIGQNVVGVLEAYLQPDVGLAELDYQAPYTVVLTDLSLVADGTDILRVGSATLELAEIPKVGRPIQIKRIDLAQPQLRFVEAPQAGGLIGWSSLLRSQAVEDPESVPQGRRLSDVLVMREVNIADGLLEYRTAAQPEPMTIRDVDLALRTEPASEPGWYALATVLEKPGLFTIDLDGRVNLDTTVLDLSKLGLDVALSQEQYELFPPQIQALLRQHEVRGALRAAFSGTISVMQPLTSTVQGRLSLADAFVALEDKVLPLDLFEIDLQVAQGLAAADYRAQLLDGSLSGRATVGLEGDRPLDLSWTAEALEMLETLRVATGEAPRYAGKVSGAGALRANLAAIPDSLSGAGEVHLRQGRLVQLPIIAQIVAAVEGGKKPDPSKFSDEADATFKLLADRLQLESFEMSSALVAARGEGDVGYDGSLNLRVNAGPLEKVQKGLGDIGKVFGALTDKLVTYHVQGTVQEPKVSIKPLGIGAGG